MGDNKNALPLDIPDYIEESLKEIIDYLWDDEFKDFRTLEGNFEGHIFNHLLTVRTWLEGDEKQ